MGGRTERWEVFEKPNPKTRDSNCVDETVRKPNMKSHVIVTDSMSVPTFLQLLIMPDYVFFPQNRTLFSMAAI